VRSDQDVFQELSLDLALQSLGINVTTIARDEEHSRETLREEIVAAGVGITGADYAVAETGSVVILPRQGLSRLVSLVPPVHIALVRAQEIVESLDNVFLLRRLDYHRNGGDMGSYLNFISGPSRTADIEQTLVVGVHGPKEVHLVLLG
jgi:L-lactate dehydrogenase complex protein LldG